MAMESSAGELHLAALELSLWDSSQNSHQKKSSDISQYIQCVLHSLYPFNNPEEILSAVKMIYSTELFIVLIYTLWHHQA